MSGLDYLKANVFPGESGGDYNALFGYANRPGREFENVLLTNMTLDEALAFADPSGPYGQSVKNQLGYVATPMGAYQIVGSTLRDAKAGLGLTGQEIMSPELQDQLGMWIYQEQGPGAWEAWGHEGAMPSQQPTQNALATQDKLQQLNVLAALMPTYEPVPLEAYQMRTV